jgi:protein involved in ribonucleotide reduction
MGILVYYSTKSGNTHRFVEKVGLPARRIPISKAEGEMLEVDEDYILIVPTYGGGEVKGSVPMQVKRFLANENNASHLKGVIAAGNTNFGTAYCLAGKLISQRFGVPHLCNVEIFGTPEDVEKVKTGVEQFWTRSQPAPPSPSAMTS